MQPVRILAHMDQPVRLLLWTIDEMVVMMIPFLIGILTSSFIVIGVGIALYRLYRKYKKRYAIPFIKAFLYWYLPSRFKWMLPSHQRYFVG